MFVIVEEARQGRLIEGPVAGSRDSQAVRKDSSLRFRIRVRSQRLSFPQRLVILCGT